MLEIYGKGYVIEHCMAFFRKQDVELAYKAYISDTLRIVAENTAKQVGGMYIRKRFIDIIKPSEKPQTSSEIKARFKKKLGG